MALTCCLGEKPNAQRPSFFTVPSFVKEKIGICSLIFFLISEAWKAKIGPIIKAAPSCSSSMAA